MDGRFNLRAVHQNVLFDFQRKLEQQREFHDRITAYSQEVEALGETLTVPTLPRKATDLLKLEAEVIQLRLKHAINHEREQARLIGWIIAMPESPFTDSMVTDLQGQIAQQKAFLKQCENELNLSNPPFPMTKETVEEFYRHLDQMRIKKRILVEIERANAIGWFVGLPSAPYTDSMVTDLQERLAEQKGF